MSARPFLAFDLEISNPFPDDHQERELCSFVGDLGISCAALSIVPPDRPMTTCVFASGGNDGLPYDPRLAPDVVAGFLAKLQGFHNDGYDIVGFNSLGFDFQVLYAEAPNLPFKALVKSLARSHVDVGFAMFCERGFMAGLERICEAAGIGAKAEGMHGDQVPALWRESREAQDKCLRYVQRDAEMTALAYLDIVDNLRLSWIKANGGRGLWLPLFKETPEGARLYTVQEALKLPLPDTSWMRNPWPREKFAGWLDQVSVPEEVGT